MSAVPFRQHDLVRALRGATKAGKEVARVEIDPTGRIVIVMKSEGQETLSEIEQWREKRRARSAQRA